MFGIGLGFLKKASQLAHTICMSCISLHFLNNAFYLAYTIHMSFTIGLRPFNDAYQFEFANVSIIPFNFLMSSLLKWLVASLIILIESILIHLRLAAVSIGV
jgi:hypothetical protein